MLNSDMETGLTQDCEFNSLFLEEVEWPFSIAESFDSSLFLDCFPDFWIWDFFSVVDVFIRPCSVWIASSGDEVFCCFSHRWKSYCGNKRLFLKLWSDLFDLADSSQATFFKFLVLLSIWKYSENQKWLFKIRVVESQIPPLSSGDPERMLTLPNIPWISMFLNSVKNHLEMLHIILTLYFKPSFFSDKTIWWASYEFIHLNEWNLFNCHHIHKFIDFSCLWFKFISSCSMLIWEYFFWCWRKWFCHHFQNVCFKSFTIIPNFLSMRGCQLAFSEIKPLRWLLLNSLINSHKIKY